MRGDAVGAGRFSQARGFSGRRFALGKTPIAGFAQGGHVVNVDTEF